MSGSAAAVAKEALKIVVTYAAAKNPLEQCYMSRQETVGICKASVLKALGLTEEENANGNIGTFTLYFERKPLENPDETLGQIAGGRQTLELKLSRQVTQG